MPVDAALTAHADKRALAALIVGAVCIGLAPVFVRWIDVGYTAAGFWRVALALPVLGAFWWPQREHGFDVSRLKWFWLAGAFFAADLAVWHQSIRFTSVANSTLLANLAPIFVTAGAVWLFAEKVGGRFIGGLVLALAGSCLLVASSFTISMQTVLGDVLGVITALFYAGYQLTVSHQRRGTATIELMWWSTLACAVFLLPVTLATGDTLWPQSARGWAVLLGMALISQVAGQGLIAWAMAHLPASFSSVSLLVQPVAAAIFAWVLLAEPFGALQALGGAVVLAGIVICRMASNKAGIPYATPIDLRRLPQNSYAAVHALFRSVRRYLQRRAFVLQINAVTIKQTVADFRAFLGEKHFSLLMDGFDPSKPKGLREYHQKAAEAHPFAALWATLEQEADKTAAKGAFAFTESSYFMLDLYANLRLMSNDPEFSTVLEKLCARNSFFSTMFEAYIFASYKRLGFSIRILPAESGKRRPDFAVRIGLSTVLVECKSLQDPVAEETRTWNAICSRLTKALRSRGLTVRVTLTATRYLSGRDEEAVLRACADRLDRGDLSEVEVVEGISWKVERLIEGPIVRQTDFGWIDADVMTLPSGEKVATKPALVEVRRFFDTDETDRVTSAVKQAYDQFDRDGAGMLYVQVPFRSSTRVLDVADNAFDRTFGRLPKQYPRIACVGLIGRFLSHDIRQGGEPLSGYVAIIPNAKPRARLPIGFSVIGAEGLNPGINRPEGAIYIEFVINEPLPQQRGRSLWNYCSEDGCIQLRLWQSFANHFRLDAVHPAFGRRVFRGNLNALSVGVPHKLMAGFSDQAPTVAVDGQLITNL